METQILTVYPAKLLNLQVLVFLFHKIAMELGTTEQFVAGIDSSVFCSYRRQKSQGKWLLLPLGFGPCCDWYLWFLSYGVQALLWTAHSMVVGPFSWNQGWLTLFSQEGIMVLWYHASSASDHLEIVSIISAQVLMTTCSEQFALSNGQSPDNIQPLLSF